MAQLGVLDQPPPAFREGRRRPTRAAMLGLFEHLEGELEASSFFHPPEKKPAMIRNLRVAMGRARFTDQEARTFRGVITALGQGARNGFAAKIAEQRAKREKS